MRSESRAARVRSPQRHANNLATFVRKEPTDFCLRCRSAVDHDREVYPAFYGCGRCEGRVSWLQVDARLAPAYQVGGKHSASVNKVLKATRGRWRDRRAFHTCAFHHPHRSTRRTMIMPKICLGGSTGVRAKDPQCVRGSKRDVRGGGSGYWWRYADRHGKLAPDFAFSISLNLPTYIQIGIDPSKST
jgi:hypothetical protein